MADTASAHPTDGRRRREKGPPSNLALPRLERVSDTEREHSEDSAGEKEAKRQRSNPGTPVSTPRRMPYDYDAVLGITRVEPNFVSVAFSRVNSPTICSFSLCSWRLHESMACIAQWQSISLVNWRSRVRTSVQAHTLPHLLFPVKWILVLFLGHVAARLQSRSWLPEFVHQCIANEKMLKVNNWPLWPLTGPSDLQYLILFF